MKILDNPGQCCGCGACANVCPVPCIAMRENEEGFLYPSVDSAKCVGCGLCEKVCIALNAPALSRPAAATSHGTGATSAANIGAYAVRTLDESIRRNSSSGGAFYELARETIRRGGCVFGVTMSDSLSEAVFVKAETEPELFRLMTSKYIQANVGSAYQEAKAELECGREVLFSGTPCQINGLKLYLQKDYDGLCCVDLICHGVPSPKVWRWYLDEFQYAHNAVVRNINFRCKESGWKDFCLHHDVQSAENGIQRQYTAQEEDPYFRLFLENLSLRPSCYHCVSKGCRLTDLTIGDFWGIENILPEMDDGEGTSVVFARTEKGRQFLESIQGRLCCAEVSYKDAVRYNRAEWASMRRPWLRNAFFRDLNAMPFRKVSRKYILLLSPYCYVKKVVKSIPQHIWKKIPAGGGALKRRFAMAC